MQILTLLFFQFPKGVISGRIHALCPSTGVLFSSFLGLYNHAPHLRSNSRGIIADMNGWIRLNVLDSMQIARTDDHCYFKSHQQLTSV